MSILKAKFFLAFFLTNCAFIIIIMMGGDFVDNKALFAANLNKYMRKYNKSRRDISEALHISYYTVSDWCVGKKYPRMDKVEMLATYFGIQKSDLIEDKTITTEKAPPSVELSADERALIEAFRALTPEDRTLYLVLLKRGLGRQ